MTTCNHYYYCKCVVLFSITTIFSFMLIILFVATATLDELPPYWTVLNCFHLLWSYLLYPYLAGSAAYLVGSSITFTCSFICITFNLYYYYITVLLLPTLCPLPPLYIYIYIFAHVTHNLINNYIVLYIKKYVNNIIK